MGFFQTVARGVVDNAQAKKLYEELSYFQAAFNYTSRDRQKIMYEMVINDLSKIINEINKLSSDHKIALGTDLVRGPGINLRKIEPGAFSEWVIGAYLISQNINNSEKQRQVLGWTRQIIDEAESFCRP